MARRFLLLALILSSSLLTAKVSDEAIEFLSQNLIDGTPLVVEKEADGHLHARQLTWRESWWRYFNGQETKVEQDTKLATHLLTLVQDLKDPRLDRAVRCFCRKAIRHHGEIEPILLLRRAVLANRTGLDAQLLLDHPELEHFLLANHLDLRIYHHGHKITLSEEGEPLLLLEGEPTPLGEIMATIPFNGEGRMTDHLYLHNGITAGFAAHSLNVWKVSDQPTDTYQLEIVTADCMSPHAWIRLTKPDGETYSVGLLKNTCYGPSCSQANHPRLLSPDPYEYMADPAKVLVTPLTISEDDFLTLVDHLRDLQKSEDLGQHVRDELGGHQCFGFVKALVGQVSPETELHDIANPYEFRAWQREQSN